MTTDSFDRAAGRIGMQDWFDASPFATLIFTPGLIILGSNARHAALSGVAGEALKGRFLFDAFPQNPDAGGPDAETVIRSSVERVIATGTPDEVPLQRYDLPGPHGGFESRYWRMMHSPVHRDGEVAAIRQDAWDVTSSVLEEQRAEAQRRAAAAVGSVSFWEFDPATGAFDRGPDLDALFGFAPGEAGPGIDAFEARLAAGDAPLLRNLLGGAVDEAGRAPRQAEFRIQHSDGTVRHLVVRGEQAPARPDGAEMMVGTVIDVTVLRRHERQLETMLAEKDTLLADVNHRVKNSLQLVASILRVSARLETHERARASLTEAAERVRAVATVHAALYHDADIRTVEVGAHLRTFCASVAEGAGAASRGIALAVDSVTAHMPVETVIALSLAVNELMTNAYKYAFRGGAVPEGARIDVRLRHAGDADMQLIVADNGAGGTEASPGASVDQGSPDGSIGVGGIGSKLVSSLAGQIGAKVTHSHDDGWSTTITFPA